MRAYTWTAVAATAFFGSLATTAPALAIGGANTASLHGAANGDTQGNPTPKAKSIVLAISGTNTASLQGIVKDDQQRDKGAFQVKSITIHTSTTLATETADK